MTETNITEIVTPELYLICSVHGQQGVFTQCLNDIRKPVETIALVLKCGCEFEFNKTKPVFQTNHIEADTIGMFTDGKLESSPCRKVDGPKGTSPAASRIRLG